MSRSSKVFLALFIATCAWIAPDVKAFMVRNRIKGAIVMLTNTARTGGGTGFQLRYGDHRFTVTNAHVCELATDGYLVAESPYTPNTRIKVLTKSPYSDLCLLEPVDRLPSLQLRLGNLKKGDKVSIWGHPRLNPLTKTEGVVIIQDHFVDVSTGEIYTEKDRRACREPKNKIVEGWFGIPYCIEHVKAQKTTAQIAPGSSGSPMVDADGRVAGVAFAGQASPFSETSDSEVIPWSSLYIFLMNYTQDFVEIQ